MLVIIKANKELYERQEYYPKTTGSLDGKLV
jgi:hypothetical protein